MHADKIRTYEIVRRAWGVREIVGTMRCTWIEALEFTTHLTRTQRDGEYFEKAPDGPLYPPASPYQDWCD